MKTVWEFISNNAEALTVATIGLVTIFSNSKLQKNNIGIAAKQQLYEQVSNWMREIRDNLSSLAADYQDQARQIAYISDGVNGKELRGEALKNALDDRYDHLIKILIPKSYSVRKSINILLNRIEAVPILSQEIEMPLAALKKEYEALKTQLEMDFNRIMAIGTSITPNQQHFEVFAKDITKSQSDLLLLSELIEDLEALTSNVLVKDIYGERRTKNAGQRSKLLTSRGIIDPQLQPKARPNFGRFWRLPLN